MSASMQPEPCRLRIEGDMTIYQVAELKDTFLTALERSPAVEVDLSAVSEMDGAGLQLLMMAREYSKAAMHEFRLVAPSRAVGEVLELLRLENYFGVVPPAQPDPAGPS